MEVPFRLESFLFLLRSKDEEEQKECPKIFNVINFDSGSWLSHYARYSQERGPIFGSGYDISIGSKCNLDISKLNQHEYHGGIHSYSNANNYSTYLPVGYNISGSPYHRVKKSNEKPIVQQFFFQVIDYYVIQINCNE